ncbi:MAG: hypothetical protein WDZ83_08385 [Rhizobiaceae bacterium]
MAHQKRYIRDAILALLNMPVAKQAMVDWTNSHMKEINRVSSEFFMYYGQAMDGWSALEGGLALWFAKLTRMPPKRARRIFYSARSFNGRAEMFEAALSVARLPKGTSALLKTIIKTARKYSAFRNRLAHGEANVHTDIVDGKPTFEMLITEPQYQERMTREHGISVEDIKAANDAFRVLAGDLMMVFNGEIAAAQLEERRELILQRPNLPSSKESAPNPSKQKKPPRPSRA